MQSINNICPSCKTSGLTAFYQAKNVPINSCSMFSSQKEALNFPRGDVILGFCQKCGFISNLAFDPSKIDYSTLAPEEQGFSGTFNTYVQELSRHLLATFDLHGKHVSEIGCGRGDFLALLCEAGDNYGVGIDPSTVSGGVQSKALNRMTFIRDYFSERYAKYLGNFVCCRHTLEHISDTAQFINSLRTSIGDLSISVFFEVPDIGRIFKEVAFWDIYYEHCSYFNLDSLARLFQFCNFEVTSLKKAYFDQYLVVEAKPSNLHSNKAFDRLESIEEMSKMVENFSARFLEKLQSWQKDLKRIRDEKKRAIVWGSGSKCVAFMTTLNIKDEIQYIVDINPNRHGKFMPGVGKEIISPQVLRDYKPEIIIVMNPIYCNEIKKMAESMDIYAEYLPCL